MLCRLNAHGPWAAGEVEDAVARGADEVLLPMVATVEQVDRTLDLVNGRCGVGILIETLPAVAAAAGLAARPLSRIYVSSATCASPAPRRSCLKHSSTERSTGYARMWSTCRSAWPA